MYQSLALHQTMASLSAIFVFFLMLCASSTIQADAYAFAPTTSSQVRYSPVVNSGRRIHKCRDDGSSVTLYLFPSSPESQTPPMAAASLLQSSRSRRTNPSGTESSRKLKTRLPAMSPSVLATCDTLPSFSTAHGLLSPEVVMRIADTFDLEQDGPLHKFLKTYKSRGPMACLPMLSDPSILPELTRAMREIA
mmetsp:Transcript_26000/g.53900  ORF Transcript_26000/g.53900 Transcript_26000/m.53900 type:complete len:193 (+) Transcript_26000:197-775(+)